MPLLANFHTLLKAERQQSQISRILEESTENLFLIRQLGKTAQIQVDLLCRGMVFENQIHDLLTAVISNKMQGISRTAFQQISYCKYTVVQVGCLLVVMLFGEEAMRLSQFLRCLLPHLFLLFFCKRQHWQVFIKILVKQ